MLIVLFHEWKELMHIIIYSLLVKKFMCYDTWHRAIYAHPGIINYAAILSLIK